MKRLLIPLLLATATLTAAAPASAADAYPRVPSRWSCPSCPAARLTRWRAAWPKSSGSR